MTYKADGPYVLRMSTPKMCTFMVLEKSPGPWEWEVLDLGKIRLCAYGIIILFLKLFFNFLDFKTYIKIYRPKN